MATKLMTFSREAEAAVFDWPQSLNRRLFEEAKRLAAAEATSSVTLRHVERAWLTVLQSEFSTRTGFGEFDRGNHSEAA